MTTNKKIRPTIFTPGVLAMGFVFLTLFIMELFFKTWCGVQCIRTGYDVTSAKKQQQDLKHMQKYLTIELVHLKSPQMLAKIVEERFEQLAIPEPEQVITIP